MATPTFGNLPTLINAADATTGWTLLTTLDTAILKQGTGAVSGIFRADNEAGYYTGTSVNLTGQHVRIWFNFTAIAFMDTFANLGLRFRMGDGTNTAYWNILGSDTYFGGWYNVVVDCDSTPDSGSVNKAAVTSWGFQYMAATNAPPKVNTWVDYIRYGDGYYVTGGTSSDPITLATISAVDISNGYGIVEVFQEAYFPFGELTAGNGSTATYFKMDKQTLIFANAPVAEGLYGLIGAGSGCEVYITGSMLKSAGATDSTRFRLDMSDTDLSDCTIIGSFIVRASDCLFKSGQDITNNTFADCGQVTPDGADMTGCTISSYEGTADTGAISYNNAADPDGELDDLTIMKGTASTHAIEFGTTSPLTMTLRGITVSGYNASNSQTDSTLLIKRTSGTVTINLVGCSGTFTYKSLGATVVLVASKVATFTPIEDGSAFTITRNSDNLLLHDVTSTTGGEVVYSYDGALDGTAATVHIIIAGKEPIDFPWTVAEGTVPISQVTDRIYSNP